MKILGYTLLTLAFAAFLAAIWSPYHWQLTATGALLLFTGAAILGNRKPRTPLRGTAGQKLAPGAHTPQIRNGRG